MLKFWQIRFGSLIKNKKIVFEFVACCKDCRKLYVFRRSFVKKIFIAVMCFILAFRAIDNIDTFVISFLVFVYLEPIGSAKPKFSEDIN